MPTASPFEAKPRWKGAPPICIATNLLAFPTLADWSKFESTNCPGTKVLFKWFCSHCQHYHVWTLGCDPSGASNGGGRSSELFQNEDYINSIRARFNLKD